MDVYRTQQIPQNRRILDLVRSWKFKEYSKIADVFDAYRDNHAYPDVAQATTLR